MALNTTNLFTTLGKAIKIYDYLKREVRPQIETFLEAFRTSCDANGFTGMDDEIDSFLLDMNATISQLASSVRNLTDPIFLTPTVTNELVLAPNFSLEDVQLAITNTAGYELQTLLYDEDLEAGEAVNHGSDTDLFAVAITRTMDGITPAANGMIPNVGIVWGPNSALLSRTQYAIDGDLIRVTCTRDSESGGQAVGSEVFQITGKSEGDVFSNNLGGSGSGPTITIVNSTSTPFLSNGGFENWTTGVPDNWTVTGDPVTEGSSGSLRGDKHLSLPAGTVTVLSQVLPRSLFSYFKSYVLHFWYKADTTGANVGTITLRVKAGSTVIKSQAFGVTVDVTDWTAIGGIIVFSIPEDLEGLDITIELDCDTTDVDWEIDELVLAPLVYHGGFGFAIFSGSDADNIIRGDRRGYSVELEEDANFQSYFVETAGIHFPSEAAADTPSISDDLAAWDA